MVVFVVRVVIVLLVVIVVAVVGPHVLVIAAVNHLYISFGFVQLYTRCYCSPFVSGQMVLADWINSLVVRMSSCYPN